MRTPPPGSQAGRILAGIAAALTSRAPALEDAALRGVLIDVKVKAATGAVRVVLLKPEYEITAETARAIC